MSTDEMWAVIDDIVDSVHRADPTPDRRVHREVADYITNHDGD